MKLIQDFICKGCEKTFSEKKEIKYKCTDCEDFHYCSECEEKYSVSHQHSFIKIRPQIKEIKEKDVKKNIKNEFREAVKELENNVINAFDRLFK